MFHFGQIRFTFVCNKICPGKYKNENNFKKYSHHFPKKKIYIYILKAYYSERFAANILPARFSFMKQNR